MSKLDVRLGKAGALGIKVGVDPGAGVDDNGRVVAVAAAPLMFDNGTAVGLVERSEIDGPVTEPGAPELAAGEAA